MTRPVHSCGIDLCTSAARTCSLHSLSARALTGQTCGSTQAGILAGQLSGPLEVMDGSYNSLMHNRAIGKGAYETL